MTILDVEILKQEIKSEIQLDLKATVKTALTEFHEETEDKFNIPQDQHYLDHVWIRAIRSDSNAARTASLILIVLSLVGFIGGAMWLAIREALK